MYHKDHRGTFRTNSNIYDGDFCENSWQLLAVNYFCKNALSEMFDWVLNEAIYCSKSNFSKFIHRFSTVSIKKTQTVVGCCYSFWLSRLFTYKVHFFPIISIVNWLFNWFTSFADISQHSKIPDLTFMQFRSAAEKSVF